MNVILLVLHPFWIMEAIKTPLATCPYILFGPQKGKKEQTQDMVGMPFIDLGLP